MAALVLFRFQRFKHHSTPAAEKRQKALVRQQAFDRSGGQCELRLSPKCWLWITPETMHACHVVSRARGGAWEVSNIKAGCPECHIGWQHNGGKPCPPK